MAAKKKTKFNEPAEGVRAFEGRTVSELNANIDAWLRDEVGGDVEILARDPVPGQPPFVVVYWRKRKSFKITGVPGR